MRLDTESALPVRRFTLSILFVFVVVSVALWPTTVAATTFLTLSGPTETTSATTNGIDVLLVGVAAAAILLWWRFRQ